MFERDGADEPDDGRGIGKELNDVRASHDLLVEPPRGFVMHS
jgi:hypothetical protein